MTPCMLSSGNDRHVNRHPHELEDQDGESVPCWRGSLSLRPFLPLQVPRHKLTLNKSIKMIPESTNFGPKMMLVLLLGYASIDNREGGGIGNACPLHTSVQFNTTKAFVVYLALYMTVTRVELNVKRSRR